MRARGASDPRRQETQINPDDLWLCAFGLGNYVLLHLGNERYLRVDRRCDTFLRACPDELLLPNHLHHSDHNLVLHHFQPVGPGRAKWKFD